MQDIFETRPEPISDSSTITFVCTGNICRSPLAEKVLRARLPLEKFPQMQITSAGLRAVVGAGMDTIPADIAIRADADPHHVAAQVDEEILRSSTLVLTMTRQQRSLVTQEFPFAMKRTFTLVEFTRILTELAGDVPGPSSVAGRSLADVVSDASRFRGMIERRDDDDIEDPYRRSTDTHERVGAQIVRLTDNLAQILTKDM